MFLDGRWAVRHSPLEKGCWCQLVAGGDTKECANNRRECKGQTGLEKGTGVGRGGAWGTLRGEQCLVRGKVQGIVLGKQCSGDGT